MRRLGVATLFAAVCSAGQRLPTTGESATSRRVAAAPMCRPSSRSSMRFKPGMPFKFTTCLGYSGSRPSFKTPSRSVPPPMATVSGSIRKPTASSTDDGFLYVKFFIYFPSFSFSAWITLAGENGYEFSLMPQAL